MDFKGKLVVVTGGARGIGRSAAFEYAKLGARVLLLDILAEKLDSTLEELRKEGYSAYAYICDLTKDDEVNRFRDAVVRDHGVPDIIHNNAYVARHANIVAMALADVRLQFEVNVMGYLRIIQAFLPAMVARKSGWIAITASPNGLAPPPIVAENLTAYSMTKAANISLSQCLASSLKQHGIGVSVLYPDITLTESLDQMVGTAGSAFETEFKDFFRSHCRGPEEVAKELVAGVQRQQYFVSAFPDFGEDLIKWAKNGMNPNFDH